MTVFEYANQLQDLADKLDGSDRKYREYSETLRAKARRLATEEAQKMLARLKPQLNQLQAGINKVNSTLNDIASVKETIQAINRVVQIATAIVDVLQ